MKASEINHLKESREKNANWSAISKGLSYAEAQVDVLVQSGDLKTALPIAHYLAEARAALITEMGR